MLIALAFNPIFIYFALGMCALLVIGRLVLGWAMGSS
jgi:hypothetical protein